MLKHVFSLTNYIEAGLVFRITEYHHAVISEPILFIFVHMLHVKTHQIRTELLRKIWHIKVAR